MSPQAIEMKESRRVSINRKKRIKRKKRNPIARELQRSMYHGRRVEVKKEKGGSKNLLKQIERNINNDE